MKSNYILIGPRCSGKTKTGIFLAGLLDYGFIDSDCLLEQRQNKKIEKIVAENSWKYLRELEKDNIEYLTSTYRYETVISVGGGAVAHEFDEIRKSNLVMLKKNGKIILLMPYENLEESAKILYARMQNDGKSESQRPRLTDSEPFAEMLEVLERRIDLYTAAADKIIYTKDKNEKEVACLINRNHN